MGASVSVPTPSDGATNCGPWFNDSGQYPPAISCEVYQDIYSGSVQYLSISINGHEYIHRGLPASYTEPGWTLTQTFLDGVAAPPPAWSLIRCILTHNIPDAQNTLYTVTVVAADNAAGLNPATLIWSFTTGTFSSLINNRGAMTSYSDFRDPIDFSTMGGTPETPPAFEEGLS